MPTLALHSARSAGSGWGGVAFSYSWIFFQMAAVAAEPDCSNGKSGYQGQGGSQSPLGAGPHSSGRRVGGRVG